jgi:hypothetical protein
VAWSTHAGVLGHVSVLSSRGLMIEAWFPLEGAQQVCPPTVSRGGRMNELNEALPEWAMCWFGPEGTAGMVAAADGTRLMKADGLCDKTTSSGDCTLFAQITVRTCRLMCFSA